MKPSDQNFGHRCSLSVFPRTLGTVVFTPRTRASCEAKTKQLKLPEQFELTVPHWSPDFELEVSQQAADSAEFADATDSWQVQEIPLDAERILVLDSDPPAQ